MARNRLTFGSNPWLCLAVGAWAVVAAGYCWAAVRHAPGIGPLSPPTALVVSLVVGGVGGLLAGSACWAVGGCARYLVYPQVRAWIARWRTPVPEWYRTDL